MAEVAAAAIAAEQVAATGVEAAAAVAIATPTLPLKIALTHLPNPAPERSPYVSFPILFSPPISIQPNLS